MLIEVNNMGNIKYIHVLTSFKLILINFKFDKVIAKKIYLKRDCMYKFFEVLDEIREFILQQYKENIKIKKLITEQQEKYDDATKY